MQLGELFQWLSLGSKTGTLLINGHGIEKRIYFQDGRIASTSSSDQREYLGHFLVSNGFITEDELKMAMEVQEESQILLGKILVMINAIAESPATPVEIRLNWLPGNGFTYGMAGAGFPTNSWAMSAYGSDPAT